MASTTPSSKVQNGATSGGLDLGGGGTGSIASQNTREQNRLLNYLDAGQRQQIGQTYPGQLGDTRDQTRILGQTPQDVGARTVTAADVAAGNNTPPPVPPGTPGTDAMTPLTGFASQFNPIGIPLLQQEPQALLAESLRDMGVSPNGGVFAQLAPIADQINPLLLLLQGEHQRSLGDFVNGANSFFQNLLTPGGNMVDYAQGLSRMLNAADLNRMTSNPLASFLNPRDAGTSSTAPKPEQQVRNFMALYNPLLQMSTPLIMQGALQDQMNLIARDYINAFAHGGQSAGNFADYVRARQQFQGF